MIITKQLRRAPVMIAIAAATTVLSALAGGTGTANATEPRVSYRQCVGDEYGYGCISEDGKSAFVVDRRCNDRAQAFIRLHNGSGWGTVYDRNGCRPGASRAYLTRGHYDDIGICHWSSGRMRCSWT